MTIRIALFLGALLAAIILRVIVRRGLLWLSAIRRAKSRKLRPVASGLPGNPSLGEPFKGSLAGMQLRILLSDRSGPGGLLRDTLMTRPSSRDE